MENEIIVVKQLPEIVEQLHTIKDEIEQRVGNALALECTEDTVKAVKNVRAALKKDFEFLESKRKEVKNKILSPYEQFELVYKDCVTNIFKPADSQLAEKISEVEDGLKEQKKKEILEYFEELCTAKNIDFVSFENTGAVVTLTASKKSLKERVKVFLDKTSDDLAMINTQEHAAEILVEYKNSLNVSQAILTVNNRHKAIEEEHQRAEEAKAHKEQQAAAVQKIDELTGKDPMSLPPRSTPVENPTYLPPVETIIQSDETAKTYEVSFKIRGSLEQLKALKNFLVKGDYQNEQF